ncbi:MAG: ATP-grasp domain-containing protein [Clostridia bacterium]|nr:ATP-grasp domain-containing protein [Clostridia bacterium]
MKALVLCGGAPQIALMKDLKERGITVVLADMNDKVAGRAYCDIFRQVSVLDIEGVKNVAIEEKVDFLITVCADQVLQVVAQVSEMLGLPCYIDFATAENVSKKSYMKRIFAENGIPSSKHVIMDVLDESKLEGLTYPLIVKPVDSYSSRGVRKVLNIEELKVALANAIEISRTSNAIVEEFVEGNEITVDVYVENGEAHLLSVSDLDKIGEGGKFVIHRSTYPARISQDIYNQIQDAANKIAKAFGLMNTPMLIQLISNGEKISVVEFCARTGGGIKFRMVKNVSGFDVVKAVVDLTLGNKPHVYENNEKQKYIINEFLYCKEGIFDHLEGFEELLNEGVIKEYYQLKAKGVKTGQINSSGDRIACFTVEAYTREDAEAKHRIACERVRAISQEGEDLIRHDLAIK